MAHLTNPVEIAREALRLLALRHVPPTPENYRLLYQEISGETNEKKLQQDPSPSISWANLIRDLVRLWDARSPEWTTARKREALEQVLTHSGSDPNNLSKKLQTLLKSWSRSSLTKKQGIETVDTNPSMPIGAQDLHTQFKELFAKTLDIVSTSQNDSVFAEETKSLILQLHQTTTEENIRQLASKLKSFWFKLEIKSADQAEMQEGLLRLLQLIIENIGELTLEDKWIIGQTATIREILSKPLNIRTLDETARNLKDIIYKQGVIKHSLLEAQSTLKQLIANFIDRLGELTITTADYQGKIETYSHKISAAQNITELGEVLKNLLQDTRAIRLSAQRSHDELETERQQAELAQNKIQKLENELEHISELIREDQLTGSLNRRGFDDIFSREASRSDRRNSPLCIALLDIDNFKKLNDTHGHQVGDKALMHLVQVVKQTLRPSDVIARYGGEEFLILLPDTHIDEAISVMIRLQRELTKQFFLHNNERLLITFSAGVALRAPHEFQESIITRADKAMYEAKRAGKNRVFAA